MLPAQPRPAPRLYDKGERRRKHVALGTKPELAYDSGNPRKVVGKCPSTISDADRDALLQRAVPLPNRDRELKPPKKVYAVFEEVVPNPRDAESVPEKNSLYKLLWRPRSNSGPVDRPNGSAQYGQIRTTSDDCWWHTKWHGWPRRCCANLNPTRS